MGHSGDKGLYNDPWEWDKESAVTSLCLRFPILFLRSPEEEGGVAKSPYWALGGGAAWGP